MLDPASDAARPRAADVAGSGPIARADDDAPPAGGLSIAGVPVTPEVAAIVLVYFVQGILGLSRLAKDFFVKDELGLDPAQASLIFSASSVPWLVKPLWGFISDSIPLFGYRRKSSPRPVRWHRRPRGCLPLGRGRRRPGRRRRVHARFPLHRLCRRRHRLRSRR